MKRGKRVAAVALAIGMAVTGSMASFAANDKDLPEGNYGGVTDGNANSCLLYTSTLGDNAAIKKTGISDRWVEASSGVAGGIAGYVRGTNVVITLSLIHIWELTEKDYERLIQTAERKGDVRMSMLLQTIGSTGIRISELRFITVESLETGRADIYNLSLIHISIRRMR